MRPGNQKEPAVRDPPTIAYSKIGAGQALFRDPEVFEFTFLPDHPHHRDARVRELAFYTAFKKGIIPVAHAHSYRPARSRGR